MLKVGLTGGIGSGKTTVAHIFELLGIPVYYADGAAKRLMNEDEQLKAKIIIEFGAESYVAGKINKNYLATKIFSDKKKTAKINSIVHPITIADAEEWMQLQTTAYAIKEAALIFEAKAEKKLDIIIGVQSPLHMRIQRVMQRDNIAGAAVIARIQKQMDETEKMNRCDFVIVNDEKTLLIPQVIKLNEKILENINRVHR